MKDSEDHISKSQQKRDSHALQSLAVALSCLSASELSQLPIPEELQLALTEYKRMKSHGAKYRQAKFLGKVMRKIDYEAIKEAYEKLKQQR